MKQVIVDVETGGLDPERCAITSIAAVAFEVVGGELREVNTFSMLLAPAQDLYVCRKALDMQGESLATVAFTDRSDEADGLRGLIGFLEGALGTAAYGGWRGRIWAHNAPFDASFLHQLEDRNTPRGSPNLELFPARCDWSCTKALTLMLAGMGRLPNLRGSSLDAVARYFGVNDEARTKYAGHSAIVDAKITLLVLERLMRAAGWLDGPNR